MEEKEHDGMNMYISTGIKDSYIFKEIYQTYESNQCYLDGKLIAKIESLKMAREFMSLITE